MAVCLAEPKEKAVHKLRSNTRRIEAQLLLLQHVPGLPPYRKEAARLLRELSRLRRAAGKVRDYDVHEGLLEEFRHSAASASAEQAALREPAETLWTEQAAERERLAAKLVKLLEKRTPDIAAALEAVLKALKPAAMLNVPATTLLELAEVDFGKLRDKLTRGRRRGKGRGAGGASKAAKAGRAAGKAGAAAGTSSSSTQNDEAAQRAHETARHWDDDELHQLRKAAKAVRYMAESAKGSARAKALAAKYEALQESGGVWHDWLQLAGESRTIVGRRDPLTRELRERARTHRAGFLRALTHRALS